MIATMVNFACPSCGKQFCVPSEMTGRRGTCKACGGVLVVPAPAAPTAARAAGTKLPMRTRRLIAEAEQTAERFVGFPLIAIEPLEGDPPERYRVEYRLRSLQRGEAGGEPVERDTHLVEVQLTSDYPRLAPQCRMLTPIFHPNIDAAGTICIGDHWTAGERLVDLVIRIGEMLAYQAYNIKSPLDGEAAMWADLNADRLPIDPRNLHPGE